MVLRTRFLGVIVVVAWSVACGKKEPEAPPTPPGDALSAEQVAATVARARQELETGEHRVLLSDWDGARRSFDRAIDLLLDLPGGVSSSPEAEALYEEVLETVRDAERAVVAADEQSAALEQSDAAAVDELTNIDLTALEPAEGLSSSDLPEVTYDIPVVMNSRVQSIIEMYQERRHDWFQAALDRKGAYQDMIQRIFAEEGVPQDMIYLAMVESAYKTRAVSRAGARGMWQFIRGTGRLYDLRQDFWVDDRFNPEKATRAAARHLKDLYEDFGDWYLVMAAYNSGPRRVERAIRRTGSRDFWEHARRRVLPRETRSYVPLILAAIVIGKNPEAYGFTPPESKPLEYDVVRLEHAVDLETAAKAAGVSVDDLKLLNPELRRWVTPLERDDYPLRVPKGKTEVFRTAMAEIPEDERVRFGTHVVRRGDTLSQIASRYGTTVDALTSANGIGRRTLIHPGQVLTVPVPPGRGGQVLRASARREVVVEDGQQVYVVRRGDTLGAISDSFRMRLSELRALNGMAPRATRIYPGQRLIVTERVAAQARAQATKPVARASADSSDGVYVVRRGDTLGAIAEAHGMGLSVLRRMNGFSSGRTRIYPGQKLRVSESQAPAAASRPSSYRVRRGDTLTKIARRFGVTIDDLRTWNGMSSDRIVVGERLNLNPPAGTN